MMIASNRYQVARFSISCRSKGMLPRFWISPPLTSGAAVLSETEAHHLRHVLRLSARAQVELFDGAGAQAVAVVEQVAKREVRLTVGEVLHSPPPGRPVLLACAVPKGERFDWLIEKATELGVTAICPLRTERSSVDPRDTKLDRLRQSVIAACKQSRRNTLLEIQPVSDWDEFLARRPMEATLLMADPTGQPPAAWLPALLSAVTGPLVIAVGPEGGWTEQELLMADAAGAQRVALGNHILRLETAAIAFSALTLLAQPATPPRS